MGTFFTLLTPYECFWKESGQRLFAGNPFLWKVRRFYDVHTSQFLSSYVTPRLYISFYHPSFPVDDQGGVDQGLARVPDCSALYGIVTPPYIWSIARPSGGEGVCFAKLVLWAALVNLVMRWCKWKLQIQMDDH